MLSKNTLPISFFNLFLFYFFIAMVSCTQLCTMTGTQVTVSNFKIKGEKKYWLEILLP